MRLDLKTVLYPVSRALPNWWLFNYLIAAIFFMRANGRLPKRVGATDAAINDFIFHRMISSQWSLLQKLCVDKQFAKTIAARAADVKIARTIGVFSLAFNPRHEDFVTWLSPHLGRRYVAKSTHGSGKVLFLDRNITERDVYELYSDAKKNFFYAVRETQYKSLERKIIIEENVSKSGAVDDYKFFCVKGHVIYCQVDVDRFENHKRALCTVPEFSIIPVKTKHLEIPDILERPMGFKEMVRIAGDLSREFDFVRVDLYTVGDAVYFGEYTFTPGAACDNFSDESFAIEFQRRVSSLMRNRSSDGALA